MNDNTSSQSKSLEFGDLATSVFSQYKENFNNLSIKYFIVYVIQVIASIVLSALLGLSLFFTQFGKINDYIQQFQALSSTPAMSQSDSSAQASDIAFRAVQTFLPSIVIFIILFIVLTTVITAFTSSYLVHSTNKLARNNQVVPTSDIIKFDHGYYLNYIIASFLVGLIVLGGTILFILPGIYLAIRMQFVFNLIVDSRYSVIEAISESFKLTSEGRVWSVLLINIITFGLYLGLVIAVGIVVEIIRSISGIEINFWTNLAMSIVITPLLILLNSHIYVRLQNQSPISDFDANNQNQSPISDLDFNNN